MAMWKLTLLTLLACSAAVADPKPSAPSQPMPQSCPPEGPILAQVDRIKAGTPAQKQTTILYENGAWGSTDTRPDVKPASGCVPDADLSPLRTLLAKATWKVTTAKIHCMAVSPIHTEYKVKDKLVWSARLCSGESLDKDSEAAIQQLDTTVNDVTSKVPKLN